MNARIAAWHFLTMSGIDTDHNTWRAALTLRFAVRDGATRITERAHHGPLRLLKPLYPEGDANCHAIIVHPPGGLVAGDALLTQVHVDEGAHAVITTPGAQKWYRSAAGGAHAQTILEVADQAALEWMPQEAIVFDGAIAQQDLTLRLGAQSRVFAWEMLCLGRAARNERFTRGRFRQTINVLRDAAPLWSEHTALQGGDPLLQSVIGWGGHSIVATAWIAQPVAEVNDERDRGMLANIRSVLDAQPLAGASNPAPGFFVVKAVGDDAESVRELLISVWSQIRFELFGLAPQRPRIWNT